MTTVANAVTLPLSTYEPAHFRLAVEAQALCMTTEDFARAYRAFAAKERPAFQGD